MLSINHLSTGTYTPVNTHWPLSQPRLLPLTTSPSPTPLLSLSPWSPHHESVDPIPRSLSEGGIEEKCWTRPPVPINEGSEGNRERRTERENRVKERDRSYTICLKVPAIFLGVLHHPPYSAPALHLTAKIVVNTSYDRPWPCDCIVVMAKYSSTESPVWISSQC